MSDRRAKDVNWTVLDQNGDSYVTMRQGKFLAVAMDIRDELQRLNALLHCHNTVGIPVTLRAILRKLPTKRKKARKP